MGSINLLYEKIRDLHEKFCYDYRIVGRCKSDDHQLTLKIANAIVEELERKRHGKNT